MITTKQRQFLEWIRDNEHHFGEIVTSPSRGLRLRGKKEIIVEAETMNGIRDLYEAGDFNATRRMFVLTQAGAAALSASC